MRAVRIWLFSTRQSPGLVEELADRLAPAERARANSVRDGEVRAGFVLSRAALRTQLASELGRSPSAFEIVPGRHGKPALIGGGLEFSLSHSDGLAALALSSVPVGIDVQRRRSGMQRMAERYFAPAEAATVTAGIDPDRADKRFGRLWTRKEACAKVLGGRLIPTLGRPLLPLIDGGFGWAEPPVTGRDLNMPADFDGAVALAGPDPFDLELTWWSPAETDPNMAGSAC